jgi:FlaA1/EpsC-like NDP-sugar epimerase
VLVTGAGGSIGVALCAQLTRLDVAKLVLVDQAEAALLELAAALRVDQGFRDSVAVLADIRSAPVADEILDRHRPDVVFHAAANKHLPLVEARPIDGVASNVLATEHMVRAARRVGVNRFVLFSTDKAVEPTSVLGRTKGVAEWIVAAAGSSRAEGSYAAVRLGNVVDSYGSVLPLFRRQVACGGPLTVTHPETTRYLMTASEAAGLAIVAGALADSNSIFWLDLGGPLRVLTLARRVSHEVPIDFVGLRPGERLHERMLWADDDVESTPCDRVFRSAMRQVDPEWLEASLAALRRHVERSAEQDVRALLAAMHEAPAKEPAVGSVAQ